MKWWNVLAALAVLAGVADAGVIVMSTDYRAGGAFEATPTDGKGELIQFDLTLSVAAGRCG